MLPFLVQEHEFLLWCILARFLLTLKGSCCCKERFLLTTKGSCWLYGFLLYWKGSCGHWRVPAPCWSFPNPQGSCCFQMVPARFYPHEGFFGSCWVPAVSIPNLMPKLALPSSCWKVPAGLQWPKNSIVLAFYGILRTFTAMKWDSNPTQYFETLLNKSPGSKYTFSGNFWVAVHLQQQGNP